LLEWVGVGAGVLAAIASFLPWFSATGTFADQQRANGFRSWLTAWGSYFIGWFPIVLLLAVAVFIVGQRFSKTAPLLPSLWLTLAVLAMVMILLRWISARSTNEPPEVLTWHTGWGLYLGLISAGVSAVAAFLAFRSSHRQPAGQ
jgi:magnesium-transporting ATPase (P-type)